MKDQGHGSHWETVLGQESVASALHEIVLNSGVLGAKDVRQRMCSHFWARHLNFWIRYLKVLCTT